MSWKCELVTKEQVEEKYSKRESVPIGWMWFANNYPESLLSPQYLQTHKPNRAPIYVELPDGPFCVDSKVSGGNHGWTVAGEAPNITVSPSINSSPGTKDGYHGFLVNGQLTDDVEGRSYD
jgi:hypothetical protein